MNILDINELNRQLTDSPAEYIEACCSEYDKKCQKIAEGIAENADKRPIILLSGPSGSGKTTSALKIESCLDNMGFETHTISMDNYFLPKHMIRVFDENDEIDYESPKRVDLALMHEHMLKMAACEEVDIPYFNFKTQDWEPSKARKLKRKKHELVLFEGIHALNPEVTGKDDIANCVYVSVRSRVQLSNGTLFHPKYIRVMRRMIRDSAFRNRKPSDTLDMFDSVQRGEELYILPYKYRSHFELDTFHGFEPALYAPLLRESVEELKANYSGFDKFSLLNDLIEETVSITSELIPPYALSREFIGGSSYKY